MAGRPKTTGPTAARVKANLRRIRDRRRLTTAEMERQLTLVGHPIVGSGITKIELGLRQVTVDDVIALAAVLACSPNLLLMPEAEAPLVPLESEVPATESYSVALGGLWAWATGEQALPAYGGRVGISEAEFASENRPHRFALVMETTSPNWITQHDMQVLVFGALSRGVTPWQLRTMFEQSLGLGLRGATDGQG
jgi:hypothetical protein